MTNTLNHKISHHFWSKEAGLTNTMILVFYFILNVVPFFTAFEGLDYMRLVVNVIAYLLIIVLVLFKVLENGPVTMHRIIGAVAVYIF